MKAAVFHEFGDPDVLRIPGTYAQYIEIPAP